MELPQPYITYIEIPGKEKPVFENCSIQSVFTSLLHFHKETERNYVCSKIEIHINYLTGGYAWWTPTGLEAWNTETGTVELLADKLMSEEVTGINIDSGKMVAISDNTELVFVGGLRFSFDGLEVYKYNYPQNKWTYVGNLQSGISGPLLIPVVGMECP